MKVKSVSPATNTVGTKAEMAGGAAAPAAAMDPAKMMEMLVSLTEQVSSIHEALSMLVEAAQGAAKAEMPEEKPEEKPEAEVVKPEEEAKGEMMDEEECEKSPEEMSDEEIEKELEKVSAELEAVAS